MNDETENGSVDQDAMADDWAAAMAEAAEGGDEAAAAQVAEESQTGGKSDDGYHQAPMQQLHDEGMNTGDDDEVSLDVILDIPVTISMEIGRTKINIRNLLQLNQGSVVELDRLAGEPLDVRVNGTLIAHGEVVVVNEKYGIRLTDVISPAERVKKLK